MEMTKACDGMNMVIGGALFCIQGGMVPVSSASIFHFTSTCFIDIDF